MQCLCFPLNIVVAFSSAVAVVASKSIVLEGAATVAAFLVRAFLVGGSLIFGVECLF